MIEVNKFNQINILSDYLEIKEHAILDLLGYNISKADDHVIDTIRSCIKKCKKLYAPKGGFVIKQLTDLKITDGVLKIEKTALHVDKIIASQLKHAKYIAIYISTIGREVERFYEKLFQNSEMLEGFIVNLIGSEAAESTAEYMHQSLKNLMKQSGLQVTNRFSPGYCNWNVEEQFKLFSFFPDHYCDISLTDSALMVPIKSVSGIIGIGENVKYRAYPCSKCKNQNCLFKKKSSVKSQFNSC